MSTKPYYVSDLDELLIKLSIMFPEKSTARIIEEEKYRKIYFKRDQVYNDAQ